VNEPKPGVYVFEFRQNLSGVARIHAKGPAGTDVKLRFAEVLNADGTIYVENLRTAKSHGSFLFWLEPEAKSSSRSFTFHGFDYVEVSGLSTKPQIADVKLSLFIPMRHSRQSYKNGRRDESTSCGATFVGAAVQLWSALPTDCPQRDERLGWSADAQVFWRTAAYNMISRHFAQVRADCADASGTDMYGNFAPGQRSTAIPGTAQMERRGRDRSMDGVDSDWRQRRRSKKTGAHGALPCRD